MMNDKGTYTQRTERNRFFSPALAASLLLSLISLASNAGPLAPATPVPSSSADYDAPHIDLFYFENDSYSGSVMIRPSGTEPKLKIYVSVIADDMAKAMEEEKKISDNLQKKLKRE